MRSLRLTAALSVLALSMSLAGAASAAGVAPAQATPVQREQAQSRFLRGKEKMAKGQLEGALNELNASLEIVASPNTRLQVARCLRDMGRVIAAYVEFGRTEIEAKELAREDARYEKAGQAAKDERLALEAKVGYVKVDIANADSTTVLKVGGDEVRRGGWAEPLPVMPGTSEIIVETPGRAPVKATVTIAAQEKKSLAIDVADGALLAGGAPSEAPATSTSKQLTVTRSTPMRNLAYVFGGAAIVGAGAFLFFGLKTNNAYSDLDSACGGGPCPPGHDAAIGEGRANQTAANVGLGVFVVGAVAAVALYILGAPPPAPAASASGATAKAPRKPASPLTIAF